MGVLFLESGLADALAKEGSEPKPASPNNRTPRFLLETITQAGGVVSTDESGDFNSGRPRVIYLQDIHSHPQAQRCLRDITHDLVQRRLVDAVALEGAFGPIDFEPLRSFPNVKIIREVADDLLQKNKISGPAHAGLTLGNPSRPFLGIDDPFYYHANVRAYLDSLAWNNRVQKTVKDWTTEQEIKIQRFCSPAYKRFIQQRKDYQDGRLASMDYVEFLGTIVPPSLRPASISQMLSPAQCSVSLPDLVGPLASRLNLNQKNELLQAAALVKTKKMSSTDFVQKVISMAEANRLSGSPLPELRAYLEKLLATQTGDPRHIIDGILKMERLCESRLAKTEEEKKIAVNLDQWMRIQKLVDFSLNAQEWQASREMLKKTLNSPEWFPYLAFYDAALARDGVLADNILTAMEQYNSRSVLVVAGGFHSTGVVERLRHAGVAVLVCYPRIAVDEKISGTHSLSHFAQPKNVFQKLVPTPAPFLAPAPAGVDVLRHEGAVEAFGLAEIDNGSDKLDTERLGNRLGVPGIVTRDQSAEIAQVQLDAADFLVSRSEGGVEVREIKESSGELYASWADAYRILAHVVDGLTGRRQYCISSFARALTDAIPEMPQVPKELLAAMAHALTTSQGETKRNLMNGLVQAFGKTVQPSRTVLEIMRGQWRAAGPEERMYLAHGLLEGVVSAAVVPAEILEMIREGVNESEDNRTVTAQFLQKAEEIARAKQHFLPVTRPKPLSVPPVLATKVRSFDVLEGDALEDLLIEIGPQLLTALSEVDGRVVRLGQKIEALVRREPSPWERVFFLTAAAQKKKFLKLSLEGYQRALAAADLISSDRRYDISSQVGRWARENRLLSRSDWAVWGDVGRLTALGYYLTPEEYERLGDRMLPPGPDGKWALLGEAVKENLWAWEPRFWRLFKETEQEVGLPALFRYVGRERNRKILEDENHVSIVEMLEEFLPTLALSDQELFIKNVFAQVSMDKSVDYEGLGARAQWVRLVKYLNVMGPQWRSAISSSIIAHGLLGSLRAQIFEENRMFQSWRQFKHLRIFLMADRHATMFQSISSFLVKDVEGKRLYQYIASLLLHPGVSDYKAVQEWVAAIKSNDPAFFERGLDTENHAHEEKKASRYFGIQRIDLSPSLLARGLILGRLDKIQTFRPFSLDYYPSIGFSDQLDQMKAKELIGYLSRHSEVNRPLLQKALNGLLDNFQADLLQPISDSEPADRARQSALGAAQNAISWVLGGMKGDVPKAFNNPQLAKNLSFSNLISHGFVVEGTRYKISLLPKHHPQAALTGNEAPSCMGFGQGNNTSYLFNPNDAFLILSREVVDEAGRSKERVLATSVLTLDRRNARLDGINAIRPSFRANLDLTYRAQFGENFLNDLSQECFIGVDNVEGAPSEVLNGEAAAFAAVVEKGYSRFFSAYISRWPQTPGGRRVHPEFVPLGFSHSDFLQFLPRISNNFFAAAPDAYSDKIGPKVGVIQLETGSLGPGLLSIEDRTSFIRPILAEDILEVSALEELSLKPFHKGSVEIQNEIVAALSNDAVQGRDREFLGMALFNHGRLGGYVLAYAGVAPESRREEIYISDHVVRQELIGSRAVDELLERFLNRVQNHAQDRYDRGKETFLVFDMAPGEKGFYDAWETNREVWKARVGLVEEEKKAFSDRVAISLKVVPKNSPPATPVPDLSPPDVDKTMEKLKRLSHQS